jgi:hypothetical protein
LEMSHVSDVNWLLMSTLSVASVEPSLALDAPAEVKGAERP